MLLTVEIIYNIMMSWKISPLLSEIKDVEHHITQLETALCISNGPFWWKIKLEIQALFIYLIFVS